MDDHVKIQVLLAEYSALRQEIVSRTGTRFGCLGLLLGIFAFVPHAGGSFWDYIPVVIVLATLIAVFVRLTWLLYRCAIRIAEIEVKVNGIVGEELLVWQSRCAKELLVHKFFPIPNKGKE